MSSIRKTLRHGYTTGSCATAAAKAAASVLLRQECMDEIEITLPKGEKVLFKVHSCSFDKEAARCSVIKDAGDDPDVTNGAEIAAEVRRQKTEDRGQKTEDRGQIEIRGGKGVGVITKPGLALPVGEPAINPVPRKMITQAVQEAKSENPPSPHFDKGGMGGFVVIISVPEGERIAKATLNERLGIIGGISILGTTGIVKPISTKAWADTISVALDVAKAAGLEEVVLTTGRTSEQVAINTLKLPSEAYIQMGDHVGYTLKECVKKGFRKATIAGQFGKFTKIASGEFETNVRDSTLELKTLADIALDTRATHRIAPTKIEIADRILNGNTARHAFSILNENGMGDVVKGVCRRVCDNSLKFLAGDSPDSTAPLRYAGKSGTVPLEVRCMLVGYEGEIVFAV